MRDIMVEVTTALVGTTTVPEIQVGISSGDPPVASVGLRWLRC